jgi:hypothetical protein
MIEKVRQYLTGRLQKNIYPEAILISRVIIPLIDSRFLSY